MNLKHNSGVFGQFSFTKLFNILVILSILLASCGTPENNTFTAPTETAVSTEEPAQNAYEPPVYTHPEPVIGERPKSQALSVDEAVAIGDSPVQEYGQEPTANGTEIGGTPAASVTPMVSPSPMPADNLKQQTSRTNQARTATSSGPESVISGGWEWLLNRSYMKRTSDAITLTDQNLVPTGSAWNAQQIDLSKDFDITFNLNFGTINGAFRGGDGIAFVLQNTGTNAIGVIGGQLGYGGITPSVAVEFDTFRNTEFEDPGSGLDTSHVALLTNGSVYHSAGRPLYNLPTTLEDGQEHEFRFQWTASTNQLKVSIPNGSGETILIDYTEDFVQTVFGGNPMVWMGFTAATASATNVQYFYVKQLTTVNGVMSSEVECNFSCTGSSDHKLGGPINTRTGGYDYLVTDISIPSAAGEISFERIYSSLGVPLYSTSLGYGWTHNHDMNLTFGEYDTSTGIRKVTLKGSTSNLYDFFQKTGSTTLTPYNGIFASLTQGEDYFILIDKFQNEYHFDLNSGKIISRTDSNGRELDYTYDTEGRLEKISDEDGERYLSLHYTGSETRIASVSDHTGRQIAYTYNGNGDLVSATDLLGETWTYQYDNWHHVTQVTDPDDKIVERTEYESNTADARAIHQYNGAGELVVSLTYNADGTTTLTDALGNTSTDYYNYRNIRNKDVDPTGAQTLKAHDANFRPTIITDAVGDTTNLVWSANGANLTRVVDGEGGQTDIIYDALNNPTSVIDPLNHLTTYEYDGTLLTRVMDAAQGETTYTYTPEGYLESVTKSVTDGVDVTTTYGYDSLGQRTSMTDELQNTWEYVYDDLGRLVDTIDPLERVTHNEYNAAGRLIKTTKNYDPNRTQNEDNEWNIVTEYEYDAAGNQTLVRDTLDRETRYEYDDVGRLIKTIDPELHETISQYNAAGQLEFTLDALQHHTYYFYDEAGRLKETKNELDGAAHTTYNLDGTVASTTDELNRTTYYTYDDLKRVKIVTQPGGGQTTNTYDAAGNLVAVEDPLGRTTQYEYDPVGRLIKTIYPDLTETESFYDNAGRLIQSVDARDSHTTYVYDDAGRLEKVIDQLEGTTTYEYDELGRRIAVIDANLNRTEYTYDNLDRVVAVTSASGTVHTVYDPLGQVLSRTDANGNPVQYTYTALGQVKTQTDAEGGVTTFEYDEVGNRISVQDANFHTTYTEYDVLNRPVKVIDPELNETETVYNAAGQVITTYDASNNPTYYEYNDQGLQIAVRDPLEHETRYSYDAAGQMTSMTDAEGVVTAYEYDVMGRLKAVIENYRAAVEPTTEINVRTEYTYDENGNRLTITDSNGHTSHFTYDELNRLSSESDPLENTWTYTYDALGNRISMTDANDVTTKYEYDDSQRLTGVDSTGTDADVSFGYDAGGRRTTMTDAIGTTIWDYDNLNRPISITDPFDQIVGYSYDAVGNRKALTYSGKEVGYTYDRANRLTHVNDSTMETVYQYDPTGRLASILLPNGVTTNYTYDVAGQLLLLQHATTEGNLASYQYTYDRVGNRIQAVENVPTPLSPTVRLTVMDGTGNTMAGREIYAFNGETYTGYHKTTDARGQANITLPAGDYRFRIDSDGAQFWSGTENHCTIGQCGDLLITLPRPVEIYVTDSDGGKRAGIPIYVFAVDPTTGSGLTYTGYHGSTDGEGVQSLRLPEGNYRFRADFNGTQFWSEGTCTVPGCEIIPITVTQPVTVTVLDNIGTPHAGIEVYAFDGTTYKGNHATTDENGQVQMTLPAGDYRFRADFNGTQFWSGAENHCTVPECREAGVTITLPLVVTVMNTEGVAQQGISVYAFNDSTYIGYQGTTDADGRVNLTLPQGSYRFRADYNGTQFWSGEANHCTVPDCSGAQVTVTSSMTVTVVDTDSTAKADLPVYAFDNTTYTGYHTTTNSDGEATFTLPLGSYRFRADYNGTQFWSGSNNHCEIPGCSIAGITVTRGVSVTVQNTDGVAKAGLKVYAFNGTTYTGYNGATDSNGQVTFTLPQGSYRFRADYNGSHFWSGEANHCDVPGCSSAGVTVTNGVLVTVKDTAGVAKEGLKVYAFNGSTYTGYNGTTNTEGQVMLTLPLGSYRFRTDHNGTQFWSSATNHCDIPGCSEAAVTVTNGLLVTVQDTDGVAKAGLKVYAFNGTTYTGYNSTTNVDGQATLTLPQGSYRFRADLNGTQFWSGTANHCIIPGCSGASITVTNPVTLSVQTADGTPQSGLKVYAFNGATYTGYSATTNASGQGIFTLQQGNHRFRVDYNGAQYWSASSNHCAVPGCAELTVVVGPQPTATVPPTATPTATATPTPEETETPTPEATASATDEPIPSETPMSSRGNIFAVSLARRQTFAPLPVQADNYTDVSVDEFDSTTLDSAWNWVEPLEGPSWSLTDEPGSFQFTLPPDYDHWQGVNTAPSLQRTDMGTGDFAIETKVDILTENEPGDGYKFGLLVGFSETDRLWMGVTGLGQMKIYRTGTFDSAIGFADLPVYVRIEKTGADYAFLYKQNVGDDWTNLGFYTSADAVSYVGVYGSTYDAAGDVIYSMDYFRLEHAVPFNDVTVTVSNADGVPQEGLQVYAFNNITYTGVNNLTDANGQVTLTLPEGDYHFRTDLDGTRFWSGASNHCEVPGCTEATITVTAQYDTLMVDEFDSTTLDPAWAWVEPLEGPSWSLTNNHGSFQFTVPPNYDHWQGVNTAPSLQRTDMGTGNFAIETHVDQLPENETNNRYKFGLMVGFSETDRLWMGVSNFGELKLQRTGVEDANIGIAAMPVFLRIEKVGAEYTFLYKQNAEDDWTSLAAYTATPVVEYVGIYGSTFAATSDVTFNAGYFRIERTASPDVTVIVSDTGGARQEGVMVYAYNGTVYTGVNGITDEDGQITLALPEGSYRFRADSKGDRFWSDSANHCAVPGCNQTEITVAKYNNENLDEFDATMLDSAWSWVEPLDGPIWSLTENPGSFQLFVPEGDDSIPQIYGYMPGNENTAPSLQRTDMGNGDFAIETSYSVEHTGEPYMANWNSGLMAGFAENNWLRVGLKGNDRVTAMYSDETIADADFDQNETIFLRLEKMGAEYTFLYKQNAGDDWSYLGSYTKPNVVGYVGVFGDSFATTSDVTYNFDYFRLENEVTSANLTATVVDTDGAPQAGVRVYVFDDAPSTSGPLYTGFSGVTDSEGHVSFNLPVGAYRFRATLNSTQFWNDEADECSVPNCKQVEITVSKPVTVTVQDSASAPKEGLKVYAFDGSRYAGYNGTTDANGQAIITLPLGSYRFRVDLNGTQFWNSTENSCAVPGCTSASISVSLPLTVTVLDTDSAPKEGLNVYAFDETTYSGYHLTTNASGQATFTLPFGIYRFRAHLNGTHFWSGSANHCDPNAECEPPVITVSKPVTVTVLDTIGTPYSKLPVYAFDGTTYTGYHATTNALGKATLTLPLGAFSAYHFRVDLNGTQFWNSTDNNCPVPSCTTADITLPGGLAQTEVTIDYTYDPLYRLTKAKYSNNNTYAYTYDAVGNRLTASDPYSITSYQYDIANRLESVDGIPYVYDANGNLLNDGVNTYTYDSANRLKTVSSGQSAVTSYQYNGIGDRLSQNGVIYTLDLNTGLPQVLTDSTTTYTYGLGRISQQKGTTSEYFLGDALGSVRQLTSQSGVVTYAASYSPYGDVSQAGGASQSDYGFTGEFTSRDSTQLIYLRARWYNPADGRFQSRDTWEGEVNLPITHNKWAYANANPINLVDPTGHYYNRQAAVGYALAHDLMDPFPVRGYDWNKSGTDCAAFVSSVLWHGGIRDYGRFPRQNEVTGRYEDFPVSYWNGDWAESDKPMGNYPGISFASWMKVESLYDFLTTVKQFPSYKVSTTNAQEDLRKINFSIGDIVFYGPYQALQHTAVITSKSAPQTNFDGFPYLEEDTTWTSYIKAKKNSAENEKAFRGQALEIWEQTRCDYQGSPWLPRVVERSGSTLYHESRSINDTMKPYDIRIVHVY